MKDNAIEICLKLAIGASAAFIDVVALAMIMLGLSIIPCFLFAIMATAVAGVMVGWEF